MPKVSPADDEQVTASSEALFSVGGVLKAALGPGATQAIENHLAAVLQVKNLVLFIGSGASFHLGSPHTRQLKNAAVDDMVVASGGALSDKDNKLLGAINATDSGDLERLLNSLQLAATLASESADQSVSLNVGDALEKFTRTDIEQLRKRLNSALAFACNLPAASAKLADPYAAHRILLSRIAAGRRDGLPRPKIFTTNYDLVIERALDQLGYPYVDGFSGTIDRRLNLAYYGLDFHRVDVNSQSVVSRASASYYLHKIHGSLNWHASDQTDSTSGISSFDVIQTHSDSPADDGSVLIYPTAAKEGDSLAYPYSDLMRLLSDALQQADTAVLCLGYGFRDAHINRILLRNLALNTSLGITVVDPGGVFDEKIVMAAAKDSSKAVGKPLGEMGKPQDTPLAKLAFAQDPRIAVLTGPGARFEQFVTFLPDPRVSDAGPAAVNDLMSSLDAFGFFGGVAK